MTEQKVEVDQTLEYSPSELAKALGPALLKNTDFKKALANDTVFITALLANSSFSDKVAKQIATPAANAAVAQGITK